MHIDQMLMLPAIQQSLLRVLASNVLTSLQLRSWWRQYSSVLSPLMLTDYHNMFCGEHSSVCDWKIEWVWGDPKMTSLVDCFLHSFLSQCLPIFCFIIRKIFLTHCSCVNVKCLTQMTIVTTSRNWKDDIDTCKAICLYWVLSTEVNGTYKENSKE